LTVMLLVDASGSQRFGSAVRFKQEVAAELCAVLAFSAIKNNDKVGLIIFTDEVEHYIPPSKGPPPCVARDPRGALLRAQGQGHEHSGRVALLERRH